MKLLPFLFLICTVAFAQKQAVESVRGKSEILLEDSDCIGTVKQRAIDLAKLNALEQAFGKVIVQGTQVYIQNVQTGEMVETSTVMNTIANSMVSGEFIEEKVNRLEWVLRSKPTRTTDMQQELWLLCEVEGKARKISNSKPDFEITTLRCPDVACRTEVFKNDERFYLRFKSPIAGHLSIFMKDFEEDVVYRILPYQKMKDDWESTVPVKADMEYIFFSQAAHKVQFPEIPAYLVDPISLGTSEEQLFNRLYIVFSPTPFVKPALEAKAEHNYFKTAAFEPFQRWLNKNRGRNPEFQLQVIDITIKQ